MIKLGKLGEAENKVPGARQFVEEAFAVSKVGSAQRTIAGNTEKMWYIWEAMETPKVSGNELDELIVRESSEDTMLLGFNSEVGAKNYETILRGLTRKHPPGLNMRLLAVRLEESHGGEKALMAVRRKI